MSKMILAVLCVVGLALGLAGAAQAGTILVGDSLIPTGLVVGNTFHLAFVTSTKRDSTSTDIAVYNAWVDLQAENTGSVVKNKGWTWYAIAATATVNARDNAVVSAAVYRLDGLKVATGFADLWDGSLLAGISRTEKNLAIGDWATWTGMDINGYTRPSSPYGHLGDTDGASYPGRADNQTGSSWVQHNMNWANSNTAFMYALSEKLTIVSPSTIGISPSAVTLDTIIVGGSSSKNISATESAGSAGTYNVGTPTGNFSVAGAPVTNAPILAGTTNTHAVTYANTSTVGAQSGTVVFSTGSSGTVTSSPVTVTLGGTILAHSDAEFVAGTGGTQTPSGGGNALLIDFGSVAQGAGGGKLTAALSLLNFESVTDYTAGLDLDAFDFSGNDAVLALDEAAALYGSPFKNMDGGKSQALHLTFNTTMLGTYLVTYTFKLSDQNGLSGASATDSEVLILTLKGTVTPEPATLALLGLGGLGMLLARKRK